MDIFNIDKYKNYLINHFRYEMDNSDERKKYRKNYLESQYSDEFLQRIVDDTLSFIIEFIESNLHNIHNYMDVDLLEDAGYINLNLIGGWFSDTLYSIGTEESKKIISYHLLHKFLGTSFRIEEDYNTYAVVDKGDDFDIYNEYHYPFIRITGDFSLLKSKYDELRELKQKELILALKRKLNQK